MNRVVVYILCFIKRSSYYVKVIFECMELGTDVRDVISLESAKQPYFGEGHEIY